MINRLEIVMDHDHPEQVELYILDELGQRVEGGTFAINAFLDHVLEFYNRNY